MDFAVELSGFGRLRVQNFCPSSVLQLGVRITTYHSHLEHVHAAAPAAPWAARFTFGRRGRPCTVRHVRLATEYLQLLACLILEMLLEVEEGWSYCMQPINLLFFPSNFKNQS